ncbi:uncharacterized protein LOC135396138 [Ornithodoros turicata]|uniref:uncharacterized protein LOC135396138 n=1 Tax=Ornithodoros turicata TaxID=34597 RepID=UPI0031388E87
MEGSHSDATSVSERPHIVRADSKRSNLKTDGRRSWSNYVSRLERENIPSCSCWILMFTCIGVFSTLLILYARKVCMLVFLVSVAFLTIFVIFFEPPDGKLRRDALHNLLFGACNKTGMMGERADKEGLKLRGKQTSRNPLRRGSMMYERYEEVRIPLPVTGPVEGPPKKKTFFRAFWKSVSQRRLQANQYYMTITEASTEEAPTTSQVQASPGRTLEEIAMIAKRKIMFRTQEQHSEEKSDSTYKPKKAAPKCLKKSIGDIDLTRSRMDRTLPSYTPTPVFSAGLKPLKTAIKEPTVARLGSKVRGLENPTVKVYNINEEGSPRYTTTVTGSEEFWRVACSALDAPDSQDGPREILKVPRPETPDHSSLRQYHSLCELEENQSQKSRTYLVRQGKRFRKVYHVWSI